MLPKLTQRDLGPNTPFVGRLLSFPEPTDFNLEVHHGFEVGVVFTGEGERQYGDFTTLVGPGEAWLTAPWEPHGWRVTVSGTRECVFHFLPEFIADQVFEGPWYLSLFWAAPRDRPGSRVNEDRGEILEIAGDLTREVLAKRRGWRSGAQLSLLRLLHTLGREWEPPGYSVVRSGATAGFERIVPAVQLVYDSPEQRVAISEAAAACSLSPSQFRFIFLQTMGLSFGRFSRRARLAFVTHLLLNTKLAVESCAQRAGFVDGSHLHRAFVRHYGCTPTQYRDRALRPRSASGTGGASELRD